MTYAELAVMFGLVDSGKRMSLWRGVVRFDLFLSAMKDNPELFSLDEAQNDAPTTREFLEYSAYDDLFEIYVVADDRPDKRVTIEGIISEHPDVIMKFTQYHPTEISKNRLWWD